MKHWPSVLLLAIAYGCPRTESPAPRDRDGAGTDLGGACANLRRVGCPEGEPLPSGRTCYEHLTDEGLHVLVPAVCLRDAKNAADVRTCGDGLRTLPFRCRLDGG